MNFTQGVSLILFGTMVFIVGMLVLRPESGTPRDWRFWLGRHRVTGVGVALYGAIALLSRR